MKRLTHEKPQDNFGIMMNYVFANDGWAHICHDGENEDVPLTEWAKAQCIKRGCDELPGEDPKEIDETLCDCLMDGEGCPVALAYCFGCQATHLRSRLKAIEDILGEDYDLDLLRELAQAEKTGRLVVLPEKDEGGAALVSIFRKGASKPRLECFGKSTLLPGLLSTLVSLVADDMGAGYYGLLTALMTMPPLRDVAAKAEEEHGD